MTKRLLLLLALVAALAAVTAACGGSDDGSAEPAPAEPAEPTPAEEPAAPAETPAEEPAAPAETPAEEPAAPAETPAEEPAAPAETPAEEPPAEEPSAAEFPTGGIIRVGWEASFDFTSGFDPTGEYLGESMGIMSNLLIRTLVGYRHVAGDAGNEIVPDLSELPEISEDGLTYTFRIKEGAKFGPPLSRQITSDDVRYALERIGKTDADGAPVLSQYGFYYGVIAGMAEYQAGEADTISGVETPDDSTVVITLTKPTGDFPYMMAMPAAGPLPREVGSCFEEATTYGQYVVSSGPYMIAGSDAQDATSCETLKPLSGFDPAARLELVRNPDYDPASDTPGTRPAYVDGFVFEINTNSEDIFNKLVAGELEAEVAGATPAITKQWTEDEQLASQFHVNSGDRTWYITMNLTQPPFDDIAVRKAVNFVMNKEGLRRAWGGSTAGEIATHIIPNVMLNDTIVDYDPYNTIATQGLGDEEAAKAAMMESKYDTDKDGICDAPECKEVLHIAGDRDIDEGMIPVIEESLGKIGITLVTRINADAYTVIQTANKNVPISSRPGWGKDYADVSTFAVLFDSNSTAPKGNINYSLVGLTPEQAAGIKGLKGNFEGIPSVDEDIAACNAVPVGDERVACWAAFDKKLMEEVVPWVPYLDATNRDFTSSAVLNYQYDQFSGAPGWAHFAIDQSQVK